MSWQLLYASWKPLVCSVQVLLGTLLACDWGAKCCRNSIWLLLLHGQVLRVRRLKHWLRARLRQCLLLNRFRHLQNLGLHLIIEVFDKLFDVFNRRVVIINLKLKDLELPFEGFYFLFQVIVLSLSAPVHYFSNFFVLLDLLAQFLFLQLDVCILLFTLVQFLIHSLENLCFQFFELLLADLWLSGRLLGWFLLWFLGSVKHIVLCYIHVIIHLVSWPILLRLFVFLYCFRFLFCVLG